jgi:hypothetical protein
LVIAVEFELVVDEELDYFVELEQVGEVDL